MAKTDIRNLEDIKILVNNFYARVREDELLGHIFEEVIGTHWDEHLDKMYRFWQSVLLGEPTYSGSPFLPHTKLDIDERHFRRWVELFEKTVNDYFAGENATEAKKRAATTGAIFSAKLHYLRQKTEGKQE